MEDMISIIVPVYNTAQYVEKCIISVLEQTYENFELILVNDGSTDGSDIICENYAQRDSRIVYINKNNTGVSDTRNVGIKHAKGSFITFVDSDDWIDNDYLMAMYNGQKTYDADAVVMGLHMEYEDSGKKKEIKVTTEEDLLDSKKALAYAGNVEQPVVGFAVSKLFKIRTIKEYGILFDTSIAINEDSLFNYEVISHCRKIMRIPYAYYHYRIRQGSATTLAGSDLSKYRTRIIAFEKASKLEFPTEGYEEFFERISYSLFKSIMYYVHNSFCSGIIPDDIDYLMSKARLSKKKISSIKLGLIQRLEYRMCRISYHITKDILFTIRKIRRRKKHL